MSDDKSYPQFTADNWLDPNYVHRRMCREIDCGNSETANLIAALASRVRELEALLAMVAASKTEVVPKRERHVWGIDRLCVRCGVDRLGSQASDDCSGVDLSLAAP